MKQYLYKRTAPPCDVELRIKGTEPRSIAFHAGRVVDLKDVEFKQLPDHVKSRLVELKVSRNRTQLPKSKDGDASKTKKKPGPKPKAKGKQDSGDESGVSRQPQKRSDTEDPQQS